LQSPRSISLAAFGGSIPRHSFAVFGSFLPHSLRVRSLPPLEFWLEALQSMVATLAIALSSWGLGQLALRSLRWRDTDPLSRFIWSQVLGLTVGGTAILCLAFTGILHELSLVALTLVGLLCAVTEGACILAGANWHATRPQAGVGEQGLLAQARVGRPSFAVAIALAGLALGVGVFASLAPPAAPRVLALSLAAPKSLLLNGGFLPGVSRGVESLSTAHAGLNLSQLWSLWALALEGPVAANLLHAYLAVLLAAATIVLARPLLGNADAWFAGCLALLAPGVQFQLGVPLEVVPLALVAALAVNGLFRGLAEPDAGQSLVAAGILLGAAVAIAPAGVPFALALLPIYWHATQSLLDPRRAASNLLPVALAAVCVAAPWLWLGGETPTARLHAGKLLVALGPVLTIALGGLAFARRLFGLSRLLVLLVVYATLTIWLPLGSAAWAPLLPLCCVAATWGWCEVQRLPFAVRTSGALLMLLLAAWDLLAVTNHRAAELLVASGRRNRADYLAECVGSYRAAVVLDQICVPGQRLLTQSTENVYFSCPTTFAGAADDVPAIGGSEKSADASDLLIARAAREGYAYLLLAEPVTGGNSNSHPSPASVTEPGSVAANGKILESNSEVIPILEYCSADDNNRSIRYRLLKLQGPQAELSRVPPVALAPGPDAAGRLPRLPTR
jgi:hypothetical protein